MKCNFLLLIALLGFAVSCGDKDEACTEKINTQCTCDLSYAPVCGCNGKTYGNACMAECANITEYTVGACNATGEQTIVGDWEFLGYVAADGINVSAPVKKHSFDVNLDFSDEKISSGKLGFSGRSSINFYSGGYTINGKELTLFDITSTEIAGDDKSNAFENKYFRHLYGTLTFNINGQLLLITSKATGIDDTMVFILK